MEQAMLAKGATSEEALRLVSMKQAEINHTKKGEFSEESSPILKNHTESSLDSLDDDNNNDNEECDDHDDDTHFLNSYRAKRLHELQTSSTLTIPSIARSEWTRCVNQASEDGTWVLVFLNCTSCSLSSSSAAFLESCLYMEKVIYPSLASKYTLQMVQIPSHHAIPNWPEENLPTLFIYRYGTLQHQFIGWKDMGLLKSSRGPSSDERNENRDITISRDEYQIISHYLEIVLSDLGVIELSPEEKDEKQEFVMRQRDNALKQHQEKDITRWGKFSGRIMGLETTMNQKRDESDDYDDVD